MSGGQRSILAVCDLEVEYAYNFMEYLNRRRNLPFEVQAFTSADILIDYAKTNSIEILLISDKAMCPEVRELPVGKLIILQEGEKREEYSSYSSVYKYQASDCLVREVMECYSAEKKPSTANAGYKGKARIIGVYSPVGRTRKTSFALALGQILAKERTTLYLNLENYSGFEQLLGEVYERNIGDLLYYARASKANLVHKLNGMVRTIQNLDFIPPSIVPEDIQTTTSEEWQALVHEIAEKSCYEVIILDIGDGVQDVCSLLSICTEVYMPTRADPMSNAKIQQFENILEMRELSDLTQNIKKVKLPYYSANKVGKAYFEDLIWSEMGDYVKTLLKSHF